MKQKSLQQFIGIKFLFITALLLLNSSCCQYRELKNDILVNNIFIGFNNINYELNQLYVAERWIEQQTNCNNVKFYNSIIDTVEYNKYHIINIFINTNGISYSFGNYNILYANSIYANDSNRSERLNATIIAHEILHCFGAIDLYYIENTNSIMSNADIQNNNATIDDLNKKILKVK